MKEGIHPKYGEAEVTCACGNKFKVGSTKEEIYTEACSACHPFYTGHTRLMDSTGRVERFTKMLEKTKAKKTAGNEKSTKKKARASKSKKLG